MSKKIKLKIDKKKVTSLWADFKKFISKGNVLDMAIGVIVGGAFGAIVTAFTNILLTLCTWGIPGGISGLITVLPPLNEGQMVPVGLTFKDGTAVAPSQVLLNAEEYLNLSSAAAQSMYTKHGGSYVYNGAAVFDWGALINSVISFLIIALVLFVILKVYNYLKHRRAMLAAARLEKHYQEHPEERPVPPTPSPTELQVLSEIRDLLKQNTEHKN